MKKTLISLAAIVATAAVVHAGSPAKQINQPAAKAMGQWYVGGYGGGSFYQSNLLNPLATALLGLSENHKIGWNAGFKLGYDFAPDAFARLALEADVQFNRFNRKFTDGTDNAKASFFSYTTMLNALAKFDCGAWQPYVGAGAGYYNLRTKFSPDGADSATTYRGGFAWQFLAGTDYKLDANWALFAEYKWLNYELREAKTDVDMVFFSKGRIGQQLVNLGVRYSF